MIFIYLFGIAIAPIVLGIIACFELLYRVKHSGDPRNLAQNDAGALVVEQGERRPRPRAAG